MKKQKMIREPVISIPIPTYDKELAVLLIIIIIIIIIITVFI